MSIAVLIRKDCMIKIIELLTGRDGNALELQERRGMNRNNMKLFYKQPAKQWEETLPLGTGSLGAMVWGGITEEKIGLNEDSLWSGYYQDKTNKKAYASLNKVRNLVFERSFEEAEQMIQDDMLGLYNESYLPLGNLRLQMSHSETVSNYKRTLDIDHSLAEVSYNVDGKNIKREYFASFPHKALFVRITGEDLSFLVKFESELKIKKEIISSSKAIKKDQVVQMAFYGQCPEHVDPSYVSGTGHEWVQGTKGKEFEGGIEVYLSNGEAVITNNQEILVEHTEEAVIMLWCVKKSNQPSEMTYEQIKELHLKDYQTLYNRVELYLGDQLEIPTDQRLENLKNGSDDLGLYALYFQYGRYLLISSSREGGQPANLQGIWNWEKRAPWSSNWTTNINTQMNYWLAQTCNLKECLLPYFDFVKRICEDGKKTAKIHYGCRGFVHHHNADIWCNTQPVGIIMGSDSGREGSVTWSMWTMGGAWLAQELFRHYEYNKDESFLREMTYPILREASLFFIDWLIEHNGYYTTCPSTSPENRYFTDNGNTCCVTEGSAMDLEIIREVFGHFKRTCEILHIEDEILPDIEERLSKLAPFKIGSFGQLLEWNEEFKEPEPGHRHISHLYGLFPSELFAGNEKMIQACKKSLEHRIKNGGGHTGWSCAWIINMFAILEDADSAYHYVKRLLTNSSYPNLWDAHPPFQIDGNFGGTEGIANMLVQDRAGEVKVLPALPKEWKEGYVKGLRLKDKKAIDIYWKDGKLTEQNIYEIL